MLGWTKKQTPDSTPARCRLPTRITSNFKKRVNLAGQQAQLDDRFPRGIRTTFMIYEHVLVQDYSDLFHITLHGDDVQGFDARWDEILSSTPGGTLGRYSWKVSIRHWEVCCCLKL